jgi:DNA repair exonuclease SbcCD ATPase subunit
MQINKLEINRYKNLRSFCQSFESGINFISGPNEAGKSSLVEAITDLLFTDASSTKKELKDKVGWDSEKSFDITMEFTNDDISYRLYKDFESGEAVLIKQSNGEEIRDRNKIMNVIESALGMANRDIFLATTTIRQDEISRVSRSSEAIKDKLEGLITGGHEEVLASEALSKIDENIRNIKKEGHKHFGVIQKLERNKAELVYEHDKAKREIEQIAQNRVKLKETQSLLNGITIEHDAKKAHMEKASKAAQNEERLHEHEERFQDLNNRVKSVQSSENILSDLKKEIADVPKIGVDDLSLAEEQAAQIRYLNSKITTLEEQTDNLAEKIAISKPSMILKLTAVFTFLVALASGAYYYYIMNMTDTRFLYAGAAGIVIFFILSTFWSSKARHTKNLKQQYDVKQSALDENLSDQENARVSIETVLEKYKISDVPDLKSAFENYNDLEKEIKNEMRRFDSWLDGKTLRELEKELQKITKDLAIETETSRDLRMYSLDAEEVEKLNILVEALEKQKKVLQSTETSLKRQLEFAESGCELQASLEERLEAIELDISSAKYQLKVLQATKNFIEKARKNVLKASLGHLEQETSTILSEVTNSKYTRVKFDRQSLQFEVFSPEKDDWVNPDEALSRGTRDQLYLAARMALVRIISQDRKPVLIFDEPFLTFDKIRREKAVQILKHYSNVYQIFVLSCSDYFEKYADKKIELVSENMMSGPVMA